MVNTQSETYIQQVLTCPAEKSWQIPQLRAQIFIHVFSLARSNSLFLHCFPSLMFLFSLFNVGNGGACFCSVVVVCSPPLFTVWSVRYLTRWQQELHLHREGGAQQYAQEWLTLLRHAPWLWWVEDSCRSNYSHWVEPQTADLYLILLSDHNDNLSWYNKQYFRPQL